MQIAKSKTAAIAIAIFLTLSMSASMMLIPNASAHTPPYKLPTHAYIEVNPNPIGVNQSVTVYMWLDQVYGVGFDYLPPAYVLGSAAIGNTYRFQNYNLTITLPDGTSSTTIFATIQDTTSSQYTKYTPTQVGNYTFTFTFPGQVYGANGDGNPLSILVNDTYASSSASQTLTVQSTPIPAAVGSSPMPTNYWTRPIYGENNNWYTISSNWLGNGAPVLSATGSGTISGFGIGSAIQRYPGDAVGPITSHIMWTKPIESGGVVGGNSVAIAGDTYFEGSAYCNRYANPIILDGYLYYTEPVSFTGTEASMGGGVPYGPTDCVNLQTGQLIWSKTNIPALSFGYIYDVQDPNQHGVYPPILFAPYTMGGIFGSSSTLEAFDGFTGDPLFNVTNVPAGFEAMGPSGEQLRYVLANTGSSTVPNWALSEWNSSKLWIYTYPPELVPAIDAQNGVVNAGIGNSSTIGPLGASSVRYDWNVSISSFNTPGSTPTILAAFYGNMLLCMNSTYPAAPGSFAGAGSQAPYTYFALNLNATREPIGTLLWTQTENPPAGNLTVSFGGADPTVNVFVESYKETMQWVGYSLTTGKLIWGPTASQNAFDYYGNPIFPYVCGQVAYGNLYSSGYGGIIYCYDLANGNLLWTYGNGGAGNSTRSGFNTPYGDYPTFINAVGNGVLYLVTTAHTTETPIWKGALTRAINATNGQEIWTLSDYTGEFAAMSYAIADGYATWFNGYDDQVYVVGQGPSATTVQAPLTAITAGNKVVIQGTVTDVSAGTTQTEQAADFPNGVPVASDASMGAWMSYVYQQQPCPTNFTGVTVSITAVDPNGNYIPIGTATSDANGLFHYTWTTPNIPGDYVVTATFAGTNGYWGSAAETAMTVQAAPSATAAPTPTPTSVADMYFLPVSIVIILAIVIIGIILALLMLRKRP